MDKDIVYGFLDESPSLHDKAYFFCVGILLTSDPNEKHFSSIFKRVREKILNRKLKKVSEVKFSESTSKVREHVLETIAKLPIKVVVFVVDTQGRLVADTPENYGIVIGFSIVETLRHYKTLILTVDKKFTKLKDQETVEKVALQVVAKRAEKGILDLSRMKTVKRTVYSSWLILLQEHITINITLRMTPIGIKLKELLLKKRLRIGRN